MPVQKAIVKINSAEASRILSSRKVEEDLLRRATAIARAAGGTDDFEPESAVIGDRAMARVWTATWRARYLEARYRALTRAIDAGR